MLKNSTVSNGPNVRNVSLRQFSQDWLRLAWDYRPNAFWFWNTDMNAERMRNTVSEMARMGIRDVLLHPIHGLTVEYLSADFFERCRNALSLLKAHGLKAWIYDEYGWPSGNASGLLLRKYPEARGWYLAFSSDAEGHVTATPKQSNRILDNTMGGPWTHSEKGYLDTLSREAVGRFIELTYGRYATECSEYFGNTILGFFTDEPCLMIDEVTDRDLWSARGLPWTPEFPKRFMEKFGYDIEPLYTELAGSETSAARTDYWTLVKEMHLNAYHKQVSAWCHDRGLKYTGHVGEDSMVQQVRFGGNIFENLSCMDIPGIDHLGHCAPPDDRWADHALIPSIARHNGKDQVYCEAYGICGPDTRLGWMLRRAEMFGIYGINRIALMGFHESVDGIRKHMYWSPLFVGVPWWPFFAAYRDALARSVGLTSLGSRRARYAILYPQHELEQASPLDFSGCSSETANPGGAMVHDLGRAIYGAGESFEFVFPEMLNQARVEGGRIIFPQADYDTLLAPGDVRFFDHDLEFLRQLREAGGDVRQDTTAAIAERVRDDEPSWSDCLSVSVDRPDHVRVFRFCCPDGDLFVLRNSGTHSASIRVDSPLNMALWEPAGGGIRAVSEVNATMARHDTIYLSLTDAPLSVQETRASRTSEILAEWLLRAERLNTARLSNIRFRHPDKGWMPSVDSSCFKQGTGRSLAGLPHDFVGHTRIEFSAEFELVGMVGSLGLLFEGDHLGSLSINGCAVDLTESASCPSWDRTCRLVDICAHTSPGKNSVSGVLVFDGFETSIRNHVVYSFGPMPTCDVFLAGDFRLMDGRLEEASGVAMSLPLDFGASGYGEYLGVIAMVADVALDASLAASVRAIEVVPASEDAVEVLLDGVSVGQLVKAPFVFPVVGLTPGLHRLEIRMASSTAHLFANPPHWGVESVRWVLEADDNQ